MNKTNMKGQAAMEYLMTYGWAILIVLVVGAALFYLRVFNPSVASGSVGFSNVAVIQHTYNAAGTLSLQIENRAVEQVNVTRIYDLTDDIVIDVTDITVAAGSRATLSGAVGVTGNTGDSYKLDLAIEYVSSLGSINSTGTISGSRS